MPSASDEELLTENCYKSEYMCIVFFHFAVNAMVLFMNISVFLFPNAYQLQFDFYIILLPIDGSFFAWGLNYLLMTTWLLFCMLFYICYFPVPMVLMNHTCWLIDMASITAEHMNTDLTLDADINHAEVIDDHLRKLAKRCEKIVKFRKEVQILLQWNFDVEFQIPTLMLCFLIYVLSLDLFGSVLNLIIFAILSSQLAFLCWMGDRITSRIDQLSFVITQDWYLMQPKQRKTLQMVLHWIHNMKGFTGIFKNVSLETFKSVSMFILIEHVLGFIKPAF